MKKQSQNCNNAGQSIVEVRKSQKHEVNVQKNSTLYFQIGLILCLLMTFALFEMQFESKSIVVVPPDISEDTFEVAMVDVKAFEPEKKQEPKKVPSKNIIDKIIEIDNAAAEPKVEDLVTPGTAPTTNTPTNPDELPNVIELPEGDFNIKQVDFVPIFPGCEKYDLNSEREKCLNEKMNRLVQRKFNTDIASEYGLSGKQRIYVSFKVDKTGNITEIKTRAPHPELEKEALNFADKIPKMKPGRMGVTPVNVSYNLPIILQVRD